MAVVDIDSVRWSDLNLLAFLSSVASFSTHIIHRCGQFLLDILRISAGRFPIFDQSHVRSNGDRQQPACGPTISKLAKESSSFRPDVSGRQHFVVNALTQHLTFRVMDFHSKRQAPSQQDCINYTETHKADVTDANDNIALAMSLCVQSNLPQGNLGPALPTYPILLSPGSTTDCGNNITISNMKSNVTSIAWIVSLQEKTSDDLEYYNSMASPHGYHAADMSMDCDSAYDDDDMDISFDGNISCDRLVARHCGTIESKDLTFRQDSGIGCPLELMDMQDYELPLRFKQRPDKQLRFAEDDRLVTVHHLRQWSYAYRQCRKGPWQDLARERAHFNRVIERMDAMLGPIILEKVQQLSCRQ